MIIYFIVFIFILNVNANLIWELDLKNKKKCNDIFEHINLVGNNAKCILHEDYLELFKPKNNKRSEVHGIKGLKFEKENKYYISWDFMVDNTVTNNAIFQWKAYGTNMLQNYPIIIKTIDGNLVLEQYQPGKYKNILNTLIKIPIEINKWYKHTLGIYISDGLNSGTIEYWFNDKKQKMYKNSTYKFKCRTFDGSYIDSKWGIYGSLDNNYNSYIKNIKIYKNNNTSIIN